MNGDQIDKGDLPPSREIPEAVRVRIHDTVLAGIGVERRRRGAVMASAAAAVILALGVVAVARQVGSSADSRTAGAQAPGAAQRVPDVGVDSPLDQARVDDELDRCFAAGVHTGNQGRVPPRDQWQAVFQVGDPRVTVTAVRTPTTPLFCQSTPATATLSQPLSAADGRTAAMMITGEGTVAGVLDPTWEQAMIEITGRAKDKYTGRAQHKDGLFVLLSPVSPSGADITVRPGEDIAALPMPLAAPGWSWSDAPAADRSTDRGRLLGACLERAEEGNGVVDSATWRPGAVAEAEGQRVIMAVNSGGVGACVRHGERTEFSAYLRVPAESTPGKPVLLDVAPTIGARPLLAGTAPSGSRRMSLLLPDGRTAEADIADSTFAVLLPAEMSSGAKGPLVPELGAITVQVFGDGDRLLYEGPVI